MGTIIILYVSLFFVGSISSNERNDFQSSVLFKGVHTLEREEPGTSAVVLGNLDGSDERKRRSAEEVDPKFFFGGNNFGNFNPGYNHPGFNPCGRKRRSAQKGDTKHFGGNNNCGGYNGGYNNGYGGGFNNGYGGGYNNGYGGGYNNGYNSGYNNYNNGGCHCTSLTIFRNGRREGNCLTSDHGGAWCYTTGWNQECSDYHSSQQYRNNPWSYQACRSYRGN